MHRVSCLVASMMLSAAPALPCSTGPAGFMDGVVVPFEGRTVPRNAELRAPVFFADVGRASLVRLDDGEPIDVDVAYDVEGAFFTPAAALDSTAYELVLFGDTGAERRVAFDVDDAEDFDAPAAPLASATNHTIGDPLRLNTCARRWPTDEITISVDAANDAALLVVDGVHRAAIGESLHGDVTFVDGRGGVAGFDVVVRDLAGNESEPTRVEVWAGCDGGCTSAAGTYPSRSRSGRWPFIDGVDAAQPGPDVPSNDGFAATHPPPFARRQHPRPSLLVRTRTLDRVIPARLRRAGIDRTSSLLSLA